MRSIVANVLIAVLAFACGWLGSVQFERVRAPDPIVIKEVEEAKELSYPGYTSDFFVIATDGTVCETDQQRFLGAKAGRNFSARASEWR